MTQPAKELLSEFYQDDPAKLTQAYQRVVNHRCPACNSMLTMYPRVEDQPAGEHAGACLNLDCRIAARAHVRWITFETLNRPVAWFSPGNPHFMQKCASKGHKDSIIRSSPEEVTYKCDRCGWVHTKIREEEA